MSSRSMLLALAAVLLQTPALTQAFQDDLLQQCGTTTVFSNHRQGRLRQSGVSRVVGGIPSPEGSSPWMVSLQLLHPGMGYVGHICGGVLIHQSWVVTAAHCIKNEKYALPISHLWSVQFGPELKRFAIKEIVIHEMFAGYNHDIALVQLSNPAPYVPVCLPKSGQGFQGIRCVASGWSTTSAAPTTLTRRMGIPGPRAHVHLSVVSSSVCRNRYLSAYNITLNAGHLCAAGKGLLTSGTCLGDSGGPLQCNMADGRWYLAGITAFGSGCGRPGYPDVYTRLAYYLPWIKVQIKKHESAEKSGNYL
ncbi:Hypothetical predicted protein [Cloeon dipterum]|uniref:Peptidase S1 domain-containing protein n=1 Tax=Cloeon dipterum TaxID=197152 RepID=A0A8S1DB83_9INSE|nr:Hypothetical predicted protein [Cloeon dipterum]